MPKVVLEPGSPGFLAQCLIHSAISSVLIAYLVISAMVIPSTLSINPHSENEANGDLNLNALDRERRKSTVFESEQSSRDSPQMKLSEEMARHLDHGKHIYFSDANRMSKTETGKFEMPDSYLDRWNTADEENVNSDFRDAENVNSFSEASRKSNIETGKFEMPDSYLDRWNTADEENVNSDFRDEENVNSFSEANRMSKTETGRFEMPDSYLDRFRWDADEENVNSDLRNKENVNINSEHSLRSSGMGARSMDEDEENVNNDLRNKENVNINNEHLLRFSEMNARSKEEEEDNELLDDVSGLKMGEVRERRSVGGDKIRSGGGLSTSGFGSDVASLFTEVSNNSSHEATCNNMCGTKRAVPCSCDAACFVYKTCCEDVPTSCPNLEKEARNFFGDALVDTDPENIECHKSNFMMVSRCPGNKEPMLELEDWPQNFVTAIFDMAVVFDNSTGIVFKNRQVNKCYYGNNTSNSNSTSLIGWRHFRSNVENIRDLITSSVFDPTMRMQNIDPKDVVFLPHSPEVAGHVCARDIVNVCEEKFKSMDPENKCGKFISYFETVWAGQKPVPNFFNPVVFGNRYCFYCNTNKTDGVISKNVIFSSEKGTINIDGNLTSNGTLSIETTRKFPGWVKAECYNENTQTPNTTSHNFQQTSRKKLKQKSRCQIFSCENMKDAKIVDNLCLTTGNLTEIVSYPPNKNDKTFPLIELTLFLTCYLEEKKWNSFYGYPQMPSFTIFQVNTDYSLRYTLQKDRNITEFDDLVGGLDSYYTLRWKIKFGPHISLQSISGGLHEAIKYWYIRKDFAFSSEWRTLLKYYPWNITDSLYGFEDRSYKNKFTVENEEELAEKHPERFLRRRPGFSSTTPGRIFVSTGLGPVPEVDEGSLDRCFDQGVRGSGGRDHQEGGRSALGSGVGRAGGVRGACCHSVLLVAMVMVVVEGMVVDCLW